MKKIAIALSAFALFTAGLGIGANSFSAPPTILHVITVQWKADSTPRQQHAAIDGIRTMAAGVPGLKTIWVKTVKAQPADYNATVAMEFESKAAFEAYTNNPAHKNWEKLYLPLREESHTQDVTN